MSTKKLKRGIPALTMFLVCAGISSCAVGPDYKAPDLDYPEGFSAAAQLSADAKQPNLGLWWKDFNDPMLDELIASAIDSNPDLELADERVVEARGLLRISYGELTPSLHTGASYTRSRNSKNGSTGNGSSSSSSSDDSNDGGSTLSSKPKNLYEAGFDSIWELDVFGGARRTVEASGYNLEAQIEARRNALVTLLAEVARNYIALRGAQHAWAITNHNIEAEQETLDIQKTRLEAGIANDLTVAQAEAQLNNTRAQLPSLETAELQAIHRLSVLLGKNPALLETELSVDAPIPVGPKEVPPGLPADLLKRRPDVRQAERVLAQSTALVGVAETELFPKVTLTGRLGWRSERFSTFDQSGSLFWNFGPSITLPIFDLGPLWANVLVVSSRERQTLIQYRKIVLAAFEEVENALVALNKEQQRRDSLQLGVESNRRAFNLAKQLNDAGVVDFLNVLNAQLALFVAEDALARSDQAVSTNLVALYKALGGGWETTEAE